MKRAPTEQEMDKIAQAIATEDRVEAVNIYISITGCGLTEAQNFIKTMTNEMRGKEPERFVRKPKRKNYFGLFQKLRD